MNEVITLTCAFTREWAVAQWLKDLSNVEHNPALTNLAFVIDADEPLIKSQLIAYAKAHNYRRLELVMNSDHRPNEVRLTLRRHRIATIKEQSKDLIRRCDGEFVIGLEDDTVFSRLGSFDRLIRPFRSHPNTGFVEGVQMGRWGARMIGAWQFDSTPLPTWAKTLLPPKGELPEHVTAMLPLQYITAGGFYGYATRKSLYLNHDYYWSESQPWGPDVNFGLWLADLGYRSMIDWSLIFGHDDHGTVGWPDAQPLAEITFNKDPQTGKWNRSDIDEAAMRY